MFDTKKNLGSHLADTADLMIDFATLGEYGLEPVLATAKPCEGRRRPGKIRSTGSWASAVAHFAPRT